MEQSNILSVNVFALHYFLSFDAFSWITGYLLSISFTLSVDADSSVTELGHWLVALKDIKFDMSSITKLVEFVKR